MIEAKDTVMSEIEREKITGQPYTDDEAQEMESMASIGLAADDPYAEAEYQRRLNSLYGWIKQRRVTEFQAEISFKAGKREGRRLLLELQTEGAVTFLNSNKYQNKKLWAVPYELWQDKLKEWGIKELPVPRVRKEIKDANTSC